MAELVHPAVTVQARRGRVLDETAFDWLMIGLSLWLTAGLVLDIWAHGHVPQLETFFTPWHGVLYSGFGAVALVLSAMLVANHARGYRWQKALPTGYAFSLIGAEVFAVGGVCDLTWHTLLGIERNDEVLFSPTHLMLVCGGILMTTGPLWAAWQRKNPPQTGIHWVPPLLSVVCALTFACIPLINDHPFGRTLAAPDLQHPGYDQFSALSGLVIMLQTAMLLGAVLFLVRRWQLPFGALTLIFTGQLGVVAFIRDSDLATGPMPMLVVAALAGIAADALIAWLKPGIARITAARSMAFASPVILYGLYLWAIQLFGGGIGWSLRVWPGVLCAAGLTGLAVSFLVFPPRLSAETE